MVAHAFWKDYYYNYNAWFTNWIVESVFFFMQEKTPKGINILSYQPDMQVQIYY
jgi:hypothetical protein